VLLDFSELEEKRKLDLLGGGKEKQEEYKNKGNLTAFERMNTLMDSGTFVELAIAIDLSIKEDNITLGTGIMPILLSYLSHSVYLFRTWFTKTLIDVSFDLLHAAFHLPQRNQV
jgi:hypothetical protein